MPVPAISRRHLLGSASAAFVTVFGGCLQSDSYQAVLRNSSDNPIAGTVTLRIASGETLASDEFDLEPGAVLRLSASEAPHETEVDPESTSGSSGFVWESPSCPLGGVPSQTITFDGDSTGVEYGCKSASD